MDKQRLRVAMKVLDAVKVHFPDTKQFIEDSIDQECLKEDISADEVFFVYKSGSKELAQKNIFYFVESTLRDIVLSQIHQVIIFTCVLSKFSLSKAFQIKADSKKQFCKTDGYVGLLQPLIMQRRMCFDTVLRLSYAQHVFVSEDVLDLQYSDYFFVYRCGKVLKIRRQKY